MTLSLQISFLGVGSKTFQGGAEFRAQELMASQAVAAQMMLARLCGCFVEVRFREEEPIKRKGGPEYRPPNSKSRRSRLLGLPGSLLGAGNDPTDDSLHEGLRCTWSAIAIDARLAALCGAQGAKRPTAAHPVEIGVCEFTNSVHLNAPSLM
jgi:hypothetical protein